MKKAENDRIRVKDKMDRATVEQVLDPRTRMILYKLLNKHAITGIDGCISTGKEANVYHATDSNDRHLAIKVRYYVNCAITSSEIGVRTFQYRT